MRRRVLRLPYSAGVVYTFEFVEAFTDINNDGLILQAFDTSGNGNHSSIQSDALKARLWRANGINGRPTMAKGSNSAPFLKSKTELNLSFPLVAYLVLTAPSDPANGIILDGNAIGSRAGFWYPTGASTTAQAFGASGTANGTKTLLNTPTQFTIIYDGANSVVRANGVQIATGNLTTAVISHFYHGVRFSETVPTVVEMGFVGIATGHPTDPQLTLNEEALWDRFGITPP